jgi:hypothetical protein
LRLLTAIRPPDPKEIETLTFCPNAEGECLDWLTTQIEEGGRSVGFCRGASKNAATLHARVTTQGLQRRYNKWSMRLRSGRR